MSAKRRSTCGNHRLARSLRSPPRPAARRGCAHRSAPAATGLRMRTQTNKAPKPKAKEEQMIIRAKSGVLARTTMAGALCALGLGQAHAVSFSQGDSTIDINGTINGFYSNRTQEVDGVKTTNSALTNGLLPGWINFVFTTKVDGLDIKAHVGFAPGINDKSDVVGLPTNPGCGGATGCDSPFSQIDTRNLYFQFGAPDWGTVKVGRDIGRSEEHTSELQSPLNLVCRLLLEKKKKDLGTGDRCGDTMRVKQRIFW